MSSSRKEAVVMDSLINDTKAHNRGDYRMVGVFRSSEICVWLMSPVTNSRAGQELTMKLTTSHVKE